MFLLFRVLSCDVWGSRGGGVIIYPNDINHHQNLLILKTCATKNLPFLFTLCFSFFVLTQQFLSLTDLMSPLFVLVFCADRLTSFTCCECEDQRVCLSTDPCMMVTTVITPLGDATIVPDHAPRVCNNQQ